MQELLVETAADMGLSLDSAQVERFQLYYRLLVEWNEKMNLTAITDEDGVAKKHFLDSLSGASALSAVCGIKELSGQSLIDVGTGAGFPGVPLKILFPEMKLVLLDSLQKRIGFLETVSAELGLSDVTCIHGRAEDMAHDPALREKFDFASTRAVSSLPVILEYMSGYVKKSGRILAYKGPGFDDELKLSENAIKKLGLRLDGVYNETMVDPDWQHKVAIFGKTQILSPKYPRKQALIKKAPL